MKRHLAILLCAAGPALAHITPPVVLATDREAVGALLAGAKKYFVHELRLTPAERTEIQKRIGWSPDEDYYRFYIGRDDQQRDVGAVAFLTEFTLHGPVRVAVALGPDGKVTGARVIELTEETYVWVKPLLEADFLHDFIGRDSHASFTSPSGNSMPGFYGNVIGSLVQRGTLLYEVGMLKRRSQN